MAFEYQNFASLGVNLNRQKYGPLDISNVFTSEADLRYYLSKGTETAGVSEYWAKVVPYPYEGQVLATVIDGVVNVYVLALDAEGNFTTQEIASKIEVDGKTVKLNNEGKIELVGLENIESGKTYVPSLVNGVLTWAEPDTSTAEGQAQEISAIKTRTTALEEIVNGKAAVGEEGSDDYQPAVKGLVDKVTDVEVAIADTKGYINTEIAGLKVVIEQKDSVEHIVVKNSKGEEIASANASKFVQDSFLNDVAYDAESGKINFIWTMGDGTTKTDEVAVADFVQTYAAGNGLVLTDNEFSVDTTVIATVAALNNVKEIAEAAQTADEVAVAIDNKINEQNLGQYAIKSEVETALEAYAKTEEVSSALGDYAKSADVATTYATKTELDEKVDTGSVAHTAEGVTEGVTREGTTLKIVIDAYTKAEADTKIADAVKSATGDESAASVLAELNAYKTSNDTRISEIESAQSTLSAEIAAAKSTADDAVAAITALASGQVETNKADIGAIKGRLDTLETAKDDIETNITTIEGKITALETADTTINTALEGINSNITALTDEDSRIAGLLATKANSADVYTKDEANDEFMTQDEVDARISALIIAADPDGGKTITNIQNLVAYVDENASDIAELVTTTGTNTAKLVGIDTTVTAYVNDQIAALVLPKASREITIAEDGTLGIGEVSLDKLVQGTNTVVLSGGDAEV